MKPEELLQIAIQAGCTYEEYETHYCLRSNLELKVIITIPKVQQLLPILVQHVKELLGL